MKKACIALLIALCGILCGCQSMVRKHEITDLAIVMAVGLDASDDGRIEMSLLVQSSSDKQGNRLYVEKGETLVECLHLLTEACEHIPFFGHTEMIFIGETMWENDVLEKLDWFVRSSRLRQECTVNAVRGTSASEFLEKSLDSTVFITDAVRAVYESESLFRLSEDSRVSFCMQQRHNPTTALLLPCLEAASSSDGNFVPRFSTYLLLIEGNPVTLVEDDAASGIHLLRGEAQTLRLPTRDGLGALLMVETQSVSSEVEILSSDPLYARFTVQADFHVLEYYGTQDPSREPAVSEITRNVEETIRRRCEIALDVMRAAGADAAGISEALRTGNPQQYEMAKDVWRQRMEAAQFEVVAQADFIHSNQLGRPLGAEE